MENNTSNIILETSNLSIGYRHKHQENLIASGIGIEVHRGELIAVIGINGVGKSTLLRTLTGIQPALKGKVLLEGKEIDNMDSLQLASLISLVLTEQPISRNLSVFELVALGRQPYTNWIGRLSKADIRQILTALKLVNIEELQEKKCYELSDGQMQKVLIARALAQDTPLVILDEPTTHLDLYHKAYVLKLLKNLSRETNKAIVFASHEINLALQLCDKIILMQQGKVETGSPSELIKSGSFSSVFPAELIDFDAETGLFRIKS